MKHLTLLLIAALLSGCAAMRDEDHAKPTKQIGEAFGLRLGELFASTNQASATGYDPDSLIPVVPPGTNANFQNYFVAVTPKSGLIWSIVAKSGIPGNFETVRELLATKYGTPEDNLLISIGNSRWHHKSRQIILEKLPSGQVVLRYEDFKLRTAADKEATKMETEKSHEKAAEGDASNL